MNTDAAGKIGLFDSGLGGLTILEAVSRALPQYDYRYYGDTEHLPLGDKTEAEIFAFTQAGVEELFREGAVLAIIACNTASAETLRRLQDEWLPQRYPDRRILGVIIPTVEALIASPSQAALLIATRRTVESGKYPLELRQRAGRDLRLHTLATPSLVPLIEAGKSKEALAAAIAALEAEAARHFFDTVILGCTHYVALKAGLRAHFGSRLAILSQDEIIPAKLADYLLRHPELESRLGQGSTRHIHLTRHRPDYDQTIRYLTNSPPSSLEIHG